MATKKLLVLLFIFILSMSLVFAQEESEEAEDAQTDSQPNYYLDLTGSEPRFIQRLIWQGTDFVLRYEVVVQKLERLNFIEVERVSTEDTFAEVSLVAGRYRYRVEVYDLIDELAFITSWREFDIIRALQPSLSSFSPHVFWLDDDDVDVWMISARGQNLLPESEFALVQNNTRIRSRNHTIEGNTAHIHFNPASLAPGEYDLFVRNPGGLFTQLGKFNIGNKKPFDLNISIGYAPVIPMYGYLFADGDIEAPFPNKFYPLSGALRISFIPIKRTWGNLGVEASGSFTLLDNEKKYYKDEAYFLNTHLSLLFQKNFLKRTLSINGNIGFGASTLMDLHYSYPVGDNTENKTVVYPSAIIGLSVTYFFKKPFFVNGGADFIHIITPSGDGDMPGFVRPYLGVGVQL